MVFAVFVCCVRSECIVYRVSQYNATHTIPHYPEIADDILNVLYRCVDNTFSYKHVKYREDIIL